MKSTAVLLVAALIASRSEAQPLLRPEPPIWTPPSLEIQRGLVAEATADEIRALASAAGDRLANDTTALRLYHTGIALRWDLDLEQKPTELGGICRQVVLTWEIGPVSRVPDADRDPNRLIRSILTNPNVEVSDMTVTRRFHRLHPGETCAESDPSRWTRAPSFSEYVVVANELEGLQRLEAQGRLTDIKLYCRNVAGYPCKEPIERIRKFLKGGVTRAAIEDNEFVATADQRLERIVIERQGARIQSVELQEMNPIPPMN